MQVSELAAAKCPFCGGSEVIYDVQLLAYVCSHCGTVISEHPLEHTLEHSAGTPEVGSYVELRGAVYLRRHVDVAYYYDIDSAVDHRRRHRCERDIILACRELSMPRAVCVDAVLFFRRLLRVVDRSLVHERVLRELAAVSIYAASRLHSVYVPVEKIEEVTGASRLYHHIYCYGARLGVRPRYEDELNAAFARVAVTVARLAGHERAGALIATAREALSRVKSGRPLTRALAAFYYAIRKLGAGPGWGFETVCRELCGQKQCANYARKAAKRYLTDL